MKRKYTRKIKPEPPPDKIQAQSNAIKPSTNVKLPPDILESIEKTCEHRKVLGLFDDREERIERAIRYQEFRNASK